MTWKNVRKCCCPHWQQHAAGQCQWCWIQPKTGGCAEVWICENLCKMTHAASSRFLDRVRRRLEGRPQDYSDFLNIMRVNSQFIEWPENKAQTHPSIVGAEVRIFEHKLCHRGDLSPVSGNFNPAQIPNWLQITQLLHSFITNGDIPMVYYTLYENGYSQSQSHTFSKATPECHSWFVLPRLPWAHTNTIIVSPRIKFYFHSRSFQSFHDFVFIPRFSSFRDF